MKLLLSTKINLIISTIVISIILLFGTYSAIQITKNVKNELEQSLVSTSNRLGISLTESLWNLDTNLMHATIASEASNKLIYAISVREKYDEGTVFAVERNEEWQFAKSQKAVNTSDTISRSVEIAKKGERLGEVTVYVTKTFWISKVFDEVFKIIFPLVIALVSLIGVLGYAVNLNVSKPLGELSRIARTIAMGDLDYPIPTDRYDEIGELGRSFEKMRGSIRDQIDNLKNVQGSLAESNERFRVVMDSIDATVYVSDLITNDILFMNEYGRGESGDVSGKKCWEVLFPNQTEPCSFCQNKNFITDSETPSETYTWEHYNEDSSEWFEYRDRAIQWIDGDRVKLTFSTNITDRKKAVAAIEESEAKFRMITEQSKMGVFITKNQKFIYSNKTFADLVKYSTEELFEFSKGEYSSLIYKDDLEFVRNQSIERENGQQGSNESYQCRLVASDKEIRWVSVYAKSVPYEGSYADLVTVFDVTDETLFKIEREKLMEFIAAKNEELESIVHVASHDLRTPLVNIQGFASEIATASNELFEFAKARISETELGVFKSFYDDVESSKAYISNNVNKQAELLSSLLKVSRLGRRKVSKKALDVNEIVKSILASMAYQIQQDKVNVEVEDLPNCFGDEVILAQVFSNLIGNSIKYKGDNRCEIRISATQNDDVVSYCVEDNGIGISENIIGNIFSLFYRYDEKSSEGEGIGLSIVKRGVVMNGGKVWVESELGAGSKFFISIPAKEVALEDAKL